MKVPLGSGAAQRRHSATKCSAGDVASGVERHEGQIVAERFRKRGASLLHCGSFAATYSVPFQNYAGLRGSSRDPHPYLHCLKNGRLSTCGFVFAVFSMVGGSLSSPVIRHSFASGSLTARSRAGAGGAFLPHRPHPSAIPAWFLPWESYPPQLECGRCP